MAFDKFSDYMYYLLPAPLKKLVKSKNSFYALCKVVGKLFDDTKAEFMWVREQHMLGTCSVDLLELHGSERDMPRLKDEDIEAYRVRLAMKYLIAQEAGTNEGIKTALKALGYDNSYVEPYYLIDSTRWAEFIVWLRSSKKLQTSLNDFAVIDTEIMKVKSASSMPNYGVEFGSEILIESAFVFGSILQPRCGTFKCGAYPPQRGDSV